MEAFIEALTAENAALTRQAAALRAENKADEAVFCTVRANVYDICATVCRVRLKDGGAAAVESVYARLEEEWGAALAAAKRQDKIRKICIEEAKLEALADVRARFAALRGEA